LLIQDIKTSIRRSKKMAKLLAHASWKNIANERPQNPPGAAEVEFQALQVEIAPLPACRYCGAVSPAAVEWICCPYCGQIIPQGQAQPQLKHRKF
jgi:hypothetical protein